MEHLDRLRRALAEEEAWQRKEFDATRKLPTSQRVGLGLSWSPLRVDVAEQRGRNRQLLRLRPAGDAGLHEGIRAGDSVEVMAVGAEGSGIRGRCVGADPRCAEVLVEDAGEAPAEVSVTKRFDATTFARYREALDRVTSQPSRLRDVLLGIASPHEVEPRETLPAVCDDLNAAQRHACAVALSAPDLALIHGPPGTGKTRMLARLLAALVEEGDRPWALADSNAATDHLAVSAARAGLDVVRLGNAARIGDAASALTLEARVQGHMLAPAMKVIDKELSRLRRDDSHAARSTRRDLYQERERLVREARASILDNAQVIACTLGSLARLAPTLPAPRTAVIDEATQAVEPGVWVVVPYVERLVLVGDPHQLGPVVFSPRNLLEDSLLHRLVRQPPPGVPAPMLEVQHRMHADIQFLVEDIYGPTYTPHGSVAGHRLADLDGVEEIELTTRPVLFIDTVGAGLEEQRDPRTMSLFNQGEIKLVATVVEELRKAGVDPSDIGVIAPYTAQVVRLGRHPALAGVEVATVNSFQGREKEAIVCSFVRSNVDGELGFVADRRRLTVAVSRARRKLVLVGDSATLSVAPEFADLLERAQLLDAYATVWEPPWDAVVS